MPTISVVIPVFNSERSLAELTSRLESTLDNLAQDYEIILVNDSSKDGSWGVIQRLIASSARVKGINLSRNYGQHNAILCGLRMAQFELVTTLDDDLQHPPEELSRLLAALTPDIDVVYGTPISDQSGFWRRLASKMVKIAIERAMGVSGAINVSAFRLFRRDLVRAFEHYQSSFVSIDVLLTWGTTRFKSVRVDHRPRAHGASNYTFRKLILHATNMITGFSTVPLQVASLTGFVLTGVGILLLLYVFGRYVIEGGSVPGFPFLASALCLFSGAQLFALGVIGEYIARIHFRLLGRPQYVVSEKSGEHS